MKKYLLLLLLAITLTSCQRGCASLNKSFQITERDYEIIMYSGGDTVFHDKFRGILNDSQGSDGTYYYKEGTLIEVSGDYVIKSTK